MATFNLQPWREAAANIRARSARAPLLPQNGPSVPADPLATNFPVAAPFAPPPADLTPVTPTSSLAGQTFAPLLDTLRGIGHPTIAPFAPVAPRFEGQAPVAIARPTSSYYENLFAAKINPLSQDYFGKGGFSDQAVGEANRRGFLTAGPSGVAGQLYGKTISDPLARETANIQNQVNIIRTETEMDLAKYDTGRQDEFRRFGADLIEKDRAYGISGAEAQSRIDSTYLALESEINQAIARGATDQELANLNARVSTFQSLVNASTQTAQLNQQAAQEAARLQEERLRRQGSWYNEATATAGGLAPSVPYGALDEPRPIPLDENGNPKKKVNNSSGEQPYSSPAPTNEYGIVQASPGEHGAPPKMPNEYNNYSPTQTQTGTDGRQWRPLFRGGKLPTSWTLA